IRFGRGPGVLASLLSVLAFDFFFIPPYFSFAVSDTQYVLTFAVMLAVAITVSSLAANVRLQARVAVHRERRTTALFALTKELSATRDLSEIMRIGVRHLTATFECLETFSAQLASAIERVKLALVAKESEIKANDESLRNSLLAGISHDLRTPLAVIAGSASTLVQGEERIEPDERTSLAKNIFDEATHMNQVVTNLLDMTRLASGAKALAREWCSISELAGSALNRLDDRAKEHVLLVKIPHNLPLVLVDAALIEQVFVNIIENALKYTPAGTRIQIIAQVEREAMRISVADDGPGFASNMEGRVFDKFYRGREQDGRAGVGLGLTLAKAIIEAHGGSIIAQNRLGGGAEIAFTLPLEKNQPLLESEP
ncbi:MAG: ATP-binding protein, partial [Burkholderiales bacterium]